MQEEITNNVAKKEQPKPKYKVIIGWAGKNINGNWVACDTNEATLRYPCEIRIKTKYLTEEQ